MQDPSLLDPRINGIVNFIQDPVLSESSPHLQPQPLSILFSKEDPVANPSNLLLVQHHLLLYKTLVQNHLPITPITSERSQLPYLLHSTQQSNRSPLPLTSLPSLPLTYRYQR
jgi:hypothetical protein